MSNQPTADGLVGDDIASQPADQANGLSLAPPLDNQPTWKRMIPVIACGAGLFSDGYINNVSFNLGVLSRALP